MWRSRLTTDRPPGWYAFLCVWSRGSGRRALVDRVCPVSRWRDPVSLVQPAGWIDVFLGWAMTTPTLPRTPTSWPDVPDLPILPEQAVVIFDGSCDFCTRSVRVLRWVDRRNRLTVVPFQKPGAPEARGLTVADCERAAWTIAPDGRRFPGAAAINVALAIALGTRLPWRIYRLPGVRQLQDWVYALVARHRTRLPGDTPYCEQHPDHCR